MKNLGYWIAIIAASLLTTLGVFTLTVRAQLLNPTVYQEALSGSGIYQVVEQTIQDQVTAGLITLQKNLIFQFGFDGDVNNIDTFFDKVIFGVFNTLIDTQTGRLVAQIFDRLSIDQVLEATVNQGIEADIAWLKGERQAHQIFSYIPTTQALENFKQSSLNDIIFQLTLATTGLSELPACSSVEEIAQNLRRAESGNALELTCTNPQITNLITTNYQDFTSRTGIASASAQLTQKFDAFGITKLISAVYDITYQLATLKELALEVRQYVNVSAEYGQAMLIFALPFMLLAIIIKRGKIITTIMLSYLIAGIIILTYGAIHYYILIPTGVSFIDLSQLLPRDTILTPSQVFSIQASIVYIISYIARSLLTLTMQVGIILIVIPATIMLIFNIFIPKVTPKAQPYIDIAAAKTGEYISRAKKAVLD